MNASAPTFVPASHRNNNQNENNNTNSSTTDNITTTHDSSSAKTNSSHRQRSKRNNKNSKDKEVSHASHNNNSGGRRRQNKKYPSQQNKNPENRQMSRLTDDLQDLDLAEVASLTGASADKKGRISLNHLLNFSFPERQAVNPLPHRRSKVTSYQPFNKERFINANFRFMLNPAGNYVYQLADPDINFDWETIEQILISSAETQFCPICLSPPTAARVTKCGHIYCLPCILHYLELRENTKKLWRKCPICWESIYEADLKPVRIMKPFAVSYHPHPTLQTSSASNASEKSTEKKALACGVAEGDTVDMILIQRPAHSTLAFPLSDTWPLPQNVISNYVKPDTPLIPWHFTPAAMHFARFMLASPDYLDAEYHRDTMELKDALSDAQGWGGFDEIPYIEASLKKISETQKRLQTQKTKELALAMHTMDMMLEAVAKYAKKHPPCAPAGSSAREQPPKMMEEEKKRDVSKKEEKMKVEVPEAYLQYQLQQAGADFKPPPPQQQQQQQQQQKEKQAGVRPAQPSRQNTRHPNNNNNNDKGPATDYFFYQAVDGQHVYLHPLDIRILKHEFGEYQDFPLRLQVQATAVQESTLTEELRKKCKYLGHLPLACDVTFLEINVKDIVSADTYQHFHQELNARVKKRKEKERREEQKKQQAESKHKLQQHVREHEMERQQLLENDPFFSMYRPPVSAEESEEHLSQALSESAASAELSAAPSPSAVHDGSRTVWGTRKVPSREEELMMRNHAHEWADHIILHKSHRKKRVNKNKK